MYVLSSTAGGQLQSQHGIIVIIIVIVIRVIMGATAYNVLGRKLVCFHIPCVFSSSLQNIK
jgi:hypothetical protein